MKNINDYIITLENVLTPNLCDAILEEYANSDEWEQTVIASGVDTNIRSATTIQMSQDFVIARNAETRRKLDAYIFASVGDAIRRYNENFSYSRIEEDSGYELLRYETGQFYIQHVDSFKGGYRSVSCSLALNDDYEGGEFGFFDRELIIKAPKGGAVLFPSNFMYPHEIIPVTKGTRYSIITWFI